jgi:murein peptide amidase A
VSALAPAVIALAAFGGASAASVAPDPPRAPPGSAAIAELERAVSPQRAVVRRAEVVLGHSSEGRPITAVAENGLGNAREGYSDGPLVLAFGCIHGDECAGIEAVERSRRGCPPYGDGLVTVANLNPDGLAHDSRLNGRGVDLNRNFASDWRPIGVPGDPEHSGRRAFSEPETRIARRLIRVLRPDVTIWFHQQSERMVRAWGPSVLAARTYARLSGEPFVALPWLDGTAPNWQNHRFRGTSSFVVELPDSGPVDAERHGRAIFELAHELRWGRP